MHRREIHAEAFRSAATAVANLRHVRAHALGRNHRDRFSDGADRDVRHSLRLLRAFAPAARVLHVNVTAHHYAASAAQQIVETVGLESTIGRLIRDRDGIYGAVFDTRVEHMGIRQLLIAPRSPWQNGFAERFVGILRRELLDHVIVLGEHHLLRLVRLHAAYYNEDRPHNVARWRRAYVTPHRIVGIRPCDRTSESRRTPPPLFEGSMTAGNEFFARTACGSSSAWCCRSGRTQPTVQRACGANGIDSSNACARTVRRASAEGKETVERMTQTAPRKIVGTTRIPNTEKSRAQSCIRRRGAQ